MTPLVGQSLGQYRIIDKIGQGGMATVYKAYQPSLDRYVALKVLSPHYAKQSDFNKRFQREAITIANLNHPNILPVYDFGLEGEYSFITRRYIENARTLKKAMSGSLTISQMVDFIGQVAVALDTAHQQGIIHRDVKPSNVLMDGDWALLSDFGLVKIVVCSRIMDYEYLPVKLNLRWAIALQPLTSQQVAMYLTEIGSELSALNAILQSDPVLQELAQSPLMLSIMALAYRGLTTVTLPRPASIATYRHKLFGTYIRQMFSRRGINPHYNKVQTRKWLIWLAGRMARHSQSIFLLERMQPAWLSSHFQDIAYRIGSGLLAGLLGAVSGGLAGWMFGGIGVAVLGALSSALLIGLLVGLEREIKPVKEFKWSWQYAGKGMGIGLLIGLIIGFLVGLLIDPFAGLVLGLGGGLFVGLSGGLIYESDEQIEIKQTTNQGIKRSIKNATIIGLIDGVFVGSAIWLAVWLIFGRNNGLIIWMVCGLIGGLLVGGGRAVIQHFVLRFILFHSDTMPWNLTRFLNYCVDRIFLRKVGGGYIFIHRYLMEYFASLTEEDIKQLSADIEAGSA